MDQWTFLQLAKRVIEEEQKPLSHVEIWDIAKNKGYDKNVDSEGKTPQRTIGALLYVDMRNRKDSPFIKVGSKPRRFFLKSLLPEGSELKEIDEGMSLSSKKGAIAFEERIKQLLTDLEFKDIDGARDNFLINGIQVDVCGGWGNALLVIECKSKQKLGKMNLRSAINEFRGKIPLLEKGFKQDPKYSKYTFFKYIIVTKNIDVRKPDYDFANERPSIYIWNDDFLEYYSDLYTYIKPYAKYDLLGEMRIRPVAQPPITVPAFQVKFGNVNVYNFVMNPKDLLEVAFVARREVGKERYYQRIIEKERLNKIARYIENGGRFPNNIIISFKEGLNVKFHRIYGPDYSNTTWPYAGISYGTLEFPKDYRSCWIIDGQHRLYAFVNVTKNFYFNMPITAFEHLDIKDQRKFFLDINKNQKPVDPDLLWDLSGDVPDEKEGIISNTAKFLNTEERGPLYRMIYYPSTGIKNKKDKIKISAICIAIKKRRIIEDVTLQNIKNPLFDKETTNIVKRVALSLSNYFNVLKVNFPINWDLHSKGFILTNGGISVMIGLFEKILSRSMQKNNTEPEKKDFEFYATPLKSVLESSDTKELKNLRLRCTSEGGKSEVLHEFVLKIRAECKDDLFGGEIPSSRFKDEFLMLEKKLKDLIKHKLHDSKNKDWFRDSVDESIYKRALKTMEKNGITDIDKIHLQIGLGECISIMRKHELLFYPVFINEENDFSFSNKTILEGAFSTITTMRGKIDAHYTGAKVKFGDIEILKVFLEKINKCVDHTLNINES